MGHTEDMPLPNAALYSWMLQSSLSDGSGSWTAFIYPGMLAGNAFSWFVLFPLLSNAFSWNSSGLVVTVNYLVPRKIDLGLYALISLLTLQGAASVAFICRDLLNSTSITDLISRIPPLRASGVSLNVGSIRENRIVNIELAHDLFSVREVEGFHR